MLYANSELFEMEIKIPLTCAVSTKAIKNLGVNLTIDMKDLYNENYKILMKEIEESTHKTPCSWEETIFKMFKLPKLIYKFSANTIKLPMIFFNTRRKTNCKLHMIPQKPEVPNL